MIAVFANGDARTALSTLEMVVLNGEMDGEGGDHCHIRRLWSSVHPESLCYMIKQVRSITT